MFVLSPPYEDIMSRWVAAPQEGDPLKEQNWLVLDLDLQALELRGRSLSEPASPE